MHHTEFMEAGFRILQTDMDMRWLVPASCQERKDTIYAVDALKRIVQDNASESRLLCRDFPTSNFQGLSFMGHPLELGSRSSTRGRADRKTLPV